MAPNILVDKRYINKLVLLGQKLAFTIKSSLIMLLGRDRKASCFGLTQWKNKNQSVFHFCTSTKFMC